jgi:hypothetical protein
MMLDTKGQFTLLDIVIFCIIVIIIVSIQNYVWNLGHHSNEIAYNNELHEYADQALTVLLRTKLQTGAETTDSQEYKCVSELLALELIYHASCDQQSQQPLEQKVKNLLDNLTGAKYGYNFHVETENNEVYINSTQQSSYNTRNRATAERIVIFTFARSPLALYYSLCLWRG